MIPKDVMQKSLNKFQFYSRIQFQILSAKEQKFLAKHSANIALKRKRILFKQDSKPSGVYMIVKGKVKVYQLNYDGSIQILFIYGAGETFGFRPLIGHQLQPMSVAALEDSEIVFIERKAFMDVLEDSNPLLHQLLVNMCHEFSVFTNRMNIYAQRNIKERLALSLLLLNDKFKLPGDAFGKSEIKMDRTDLANYVGTSLENLVRTLSYYKSKRMIKIKGKSIFIEDYENLYIHSAIG